MAFVRDAVDPADPAPIVLKAIRAWALEVHGPANRDPTVRPLGGNPRLLRDMVEADEVIGRDRVIERRARRGRMA